MSTAVPLQSVTQMARRLTTPFSRGADTLRLGLLPRGSAAAAVAPYDFSEHRALFGRPPEPRYILTALRDLPVETQVAVDYTASPGGPPQAPLQLLIPAGTLSGASFLLDLGPHEGEGARLTALATNPGAPPGEAADCWRLTALLGTTAKLLWVLGWERDHLRRQLPRTTGQRQLKNALGLSLDLIGYDLGIPRFPPLPYSFDEGTIALYHLNDEEGATPGAEDIIGRYPGQPGHHGTVSGAVVAGAQGRFGRTFSFAGANAAVEIPAHSDFDIPSDGSFTVECFVRPIPGAPEGHLVSRHPDPATAQAGWALSLGEWGRGVPLNPRWLVSDGAHPPILLFGDLSLSPDRFTHLAGVVDRQGGVARLHVDGVAVAQAPLRPVGAIATGDPVFIGRPGAALQGVVDEVRLSRVARADFYPVLGERDESYRQRLRFFRRWVLPTPGNLLALLNEGIGEVNGDAAPLVLSDVNTTIVGGALTVLIDPSHLLPGESMDSAGRRRVSEGEVCGTAADEALFDPVFLVNHNDPRVSYLEPPPRVPNRNELPPDPHRMQLVVERALDTLLDLAAPEAGGGKLVVAGAFDPRAPDLRSTGRGILFSHDTIPPGRLAALAQHAGFTFVLFRGGSAGVYASCALAEYLELVPSPSPDFTGLDAAVGESVTFTVRPPLPHHTDFRWLTIACGEGSATVTPSAGGESAVLLASAPGGVTLKVDAVLRGATVSATRHLRLGIKDLPNNGSIGGDGALAASDAVAGAPDPFFHPAFLARHDDPRAGYGADPNNHLMQGSVASRLTRLLDLITAVGFGGKLQVGGAFTPGAPDLSGVGRALALRHSTLSPGQLASLAFAAGFTWVRRQDPGVLIRQGASELVLLQGAQRVEEGKRIAVRAGVQPADVGGRVRLQWTVGAAGEAQARLSSTTQPSVELEGVRAGAVQVQALYLIGDNPAPYTFEVRLKPALEAAGAVIRKEQYDLVMNILNAFHPAGVEVITGALRDHVVELQGSALEANPDYTYPKYRVRGPAPRQRKE